jgi:hypothetical protein
MISGGIAAKPHVTEPRQRVGIVPSQHGLEWPSESLLSAEKTDGQTFPCGFERPVAPSTLPTQSRRLAQLHSFRVIIQGIEKVKR